MTRIAATGSYLPVRVVGNEEVARLLGVKESYIVRMSGIRTRHWAGEHEDCSVMAEHAARRAIGRAGLEPHDLDAVLLSTTSAEMGGFPSTACLLQRRLGLKGACAFDFSASCSGFLYGLSMADSLIRSGQVERCLVVAAEIKSRYLDRGDVSTSILFGDGAGAAVVVKGQESNLGIQSIRVFSDGSYADLVQIPGGGSRLPMSWDTVEKGLHTLRLKGAPLFRVAIKRLTKAIEELLESHNMRIADVDHVIFHQANKRMMTKLSERLHIAPETLVSVIEETGNTSSASLPIAVDVANCQGRLKAGDLVLLGTFGGGITWSVALIRWG